MRVGSAAGEYGCAASPDLEGPRAACGHGRERRGAGGHGRRRQLDEHAAGARSVRELADAMVGWLESRGLPHPSVYMELAGQLRCMAVRGYWQILEGFAGDRGVLAQAFHTGEVQLVEDVTSHPDYLPAIPGVLSELCVPLRFSGRVVGALNVESPAR